MAQTIHIMPEHLANKIAAGEVVQRPASVVKELLENAIDAGASRISVIISDGGRTLIHVVDDGSGMYEDDARLAFERHATSKISTYEDLETIRTLGFRGEALTSIAAVAHVEMKTRRKEDDIATLIHIEGGEIRKIGKTAMEPGTSIAVKNLFFNTPGRRNFLKSDSTEFKHIADVVQRIAVSRPEIGFEFISDDETVLSLPKTESRDRLQALFGEKLGASLIAFREETDFLTIHGFIGRPDFARKTRAEQYLFLNKRYIVSRNLNHAVFNAYEHILEKGSYPFFILFLEIDPQHVDVNVHPSKMEVKFEDERNIYHFLLTVIRRTLATNDLIPSMDVGSTGLSGGSVSLQFTPQTRSPGHNEQWMFTGGNRGRPDFPSLPDRSESLPESFQFPSRSTDGSLQPIPQPGEMKPIWQLHHKYVLSQVRSGLMIIDQHAAHERVLYDRAMTSFENTVPVSQQLLFPQTITFSASEYAAIKELLPYLSKLGFDMKLFGKNTIVIEGVPGDVRPGREHDILKEVIDQFKENENSKKLGVKENIAASFACKAAIKAGDKLGYEEMNVLIDQLFATAMPYVCPHGRPVVIKIPIDELDKRFGRTS